MELAALVGGLALFLATLVAIFLLGLWILGPIDRAAKARRAPVRFSIGDFLCLFIAVQLPLSLAARLRDGDAEQGFWVYAALAWIVASIIWICCAMALSGAGISRGTHRFLFLGAVLPVAFYGLIPFVVAVAAAIIAIATDEGKEIAKHPWWIAIWVVTGVAIFLSGLYTRHIVGQADWKPEVEEPDMRGGRNADAIGLKAVQIGSTTPPAGSSGANGHASHLGAARRQ
jgi:hypothetical protein